jgi:hypothetical protein
MKEFASKAGDVIMNKRSFSFFGVLTLLLIFLKLTGQASIGWLWIVASFFGPILVVFTIVGVVMLSAIIGGVVIFGGACLIDLWDKRNKK